MRTSVLFVTLIMGFGAQASCHKVARLDAYGRPLGIEQVCDSSLDLPSVELDPVAPLVLPTLKPLEVPGLPPLGTTQCSQQYICNVGGACAWSRVCE